MKILSNNLFINLIPLTSVSHDGYVDKNKNKHMKTANYETEYNKQETNSTSLSGGFYPFRGWHPIGN
jgi:hypothetical protein